VFCADFSTGTGVAGWCSWGFKEHRSLPAERCSHAGEHSKALHHLADNERPVQWHCTLRSCQI